MTPAAALAVLIRLQQEAEAGWPHGYDRATVYREVTPAVKALDRAATTPAKARAFVDALNVGATQTTVEVAW